MSALDTSVELQSLLDGGYKVTQIQRAMKLNHHSQVPRLTKKYRLETYIAFDEYEYRYDPSSVANFEWMNELDMVDELMRKVLEDGIYYAEPNEEWMVTTRFLIKEFGSFKEYMASIDGLEYLNHLRKKCYVCGEYKKIESFYKSAKELFDCRRDCKDCERVRLIPIKRRHFAENRETYKDWTRNWARNNPVKIKEYQTRRLALSKNLEGGFYQGTQDRLFGNTCVITGDEDVANEHFLPISWGHGGSTNKNLYPLSRSLNSSKNNRNPFEWFDYAEKEFGLDRSKFNELIAKLAELNGLTTEQFRSFVYWCDANRRTPEEAAADRRPSVEIWKEAIGWTE